MMTGHGAGYHAKVHVEDLLFMTHALMDEHSVSDHLYMYDYIIHPNQ